MADLVTLAEAKLHLGLHNDESDDTFLTSLVTRVSLMMGPLFGDIDFSENPVVEWLNGRGGRLLRLRQRPVGDVVTTVEITTEIGGTLASVLSSEYSLSGRSLIRHTEGWPRGYRTVKVVYPGFAAVPEDVKAAALDWLEMMYRNARGSDDGGESKQLKGETQKIPKTVEAVRRKYVGVVPPGFGG